MRPSHRCSHFNPPLKSVLRLAYEPIKRDAPSSIRADCYVLALCGRARMLLNPRVGPKSRKKDAIRGLEGCQYAEHGEVGLLYHVDA